MGRSSRPVHQHREDHRPPAPGQARRPAGDPHRPGERLPHRRTLMRTPRPGPPRRLRLPRRTARLRLTVLYGVAFLACGAAVLVLTYLLYGGAVHFAGVTVSPVLHQVIRVPAAGVRRAGRYDVITLPHTVPQAQAATRGALGQMASDR